MPVPVPSRRVVRGLFVPAVAHQPCRLLSIVSSAKTISETLGGVLLDEIVVRVANDTLATLYVAEPTVDGHPMDTPPDNSRAALLAARLGILDRAVRARLRGPSLVVGSHPVNGSDTDVPATVLVTARRAGLTVAGRLRPNRTEPGTAGRRGLHRHRLEQ